MTEEVEVEPHQKAKEMPENIDDSDESGSEDETLKNGMDTENTAKKKKQKKKKKPAAKEASTANAPSAASKKVNPAVAAIKARQMQLKALEEAQKAEEEAMRLAEEAAKQAAELEEKRREEQRLKRKEKEKLKREELRKEGKLLSKSEKERQLRDRLKIEQLKKMGLVQSNLTAEVSSDEPNLSEKKKEKIIYKKKAGKKVFGVGPTNVSDDIVETELAKSLAQKAKIDQIDAEDLSSEISGDSDLPDDWDNLSDGDSSTEEENLVPMVNNKIGPKTALSSVADTKMAENFDVIKSSQTIDVDQDKSVTLEAPKLSSELRSPICCVLGHVDTGKTKLLDKIRQTNVQEGEAGGITQQIGATYFPIDVIRTKTIELNEDGSRLYNVPGLLVIDTPGHESFTNLRSRGSSLCNIAVLVVDIMHGIEPQTLESINLLKMRKTPFMVALNKIDRLYGWKVTPNAPFQKSFLQQNRSVKDEFHQRLEKTKLAFAELGLNAALCFENTDVRRTISLVPTSAITGEGIPDLLMLLIELTQTRMSGSLLYLSELECTVLEVKIIEGFGATIDVILSNGILREGDRIAVCGMNGPIVTNIRALLTPQPLREMRIKGKFVHHKMVKAALGVKISAPDLDKAIAGSRLLVVKEGDDEEVVGQDVMSDLAAILENVDSSGRGVSVQASTLGSLEALLSFLQDMKIPVSSINIGPVHKKDIMRTSVMLEGSSPELAVMLCFDTKVDKDADQLAETLGVRIFRAEIIYHLFDQFTEYMKSFTDQKKKDLGKQVVFPCILRIVPNCVFNKRDPIICGVDIVEGILKVGTPLCVFTSGNAEMVKIGRVSSIELNHKPVESVKKGSPSVAIKIEAESVNEGPKMVGRHFSEKDDLISRISREAIDILKENFRDELSKDDWNLVRKLKPLFNIV